jgi:hypothetical protein
MHAACSNGNGSGHAPETSPIPNRLGAAFAQPAASPENGGGRDAKGRFAPGNAGGPGNPFARRTAELRREFLAEASGDDLRAVCRALLERAKAGDVAAAKLALGYLVGKPDKPVDPDTLDEQEWHIWRRYTAPSEWVELIQTLPLDVILSLIRSVWPVLAAEKCAQAQPLFATSTPAAPEPKSEATDDKRRRRRRGGKRRRPEGEESRPAADSPAAQLPVEEPGPEEAGTLDGCGASGEVALDGGCLDGTQEAPASEGAAVDRPAGSLSLTAGTGYEQPGPAAEGRPPEAGAAELVAPGRRLGERGATETGGKQCLSANGGDGAGPASGATVSKRHNRPGPRAPRADAGQGPDISEGGRA